MGEALFGQMHASAPAHTLVISPTSVATALGLLGQGASGATVTSFEDALHLKDNGLTLAAAANAESELGAALAPHTGVQLQMANAIWASNTLKLEPQFVQKEQAAYGAEIRNIDFTGPRALTEINNWVSEKTMGKIPKVVDALPAQMQIALVNALHFKGRWETPFDTSATALAPFTRADKTKINVPEMHRSGDASYLETASFQAAALPFADPRFELIVVLPREGAEDATAAALAKGWGETLDSSKFAISNVKLALPRMSLSWGGDLLAPLERAGFAGALGAKADFGALSAQRITVGAVAHRSTFEVDETGAEGSSATAIMGTRSARIEKTFEMTVDRPFYFLLREKLTGSALFLGYAADPGTHS